MIRPFASPFPRLTLFLVVALLLIPAFPPSAAAYEERIHALMTERLFPDEGELMEPPTLEQLQEFREHLWMALHEAADPEQREFLEEFAPTPEQFIDVSLKTYLLLNHHFPIYGIDRTPERAMTERELRAQASRWPDDDRRNQERHLVDDRGEVIRLPSGDPMPADPAILHMGRSVGLSSQAHAHYELYSGERSDDPKVLKEEPRLFSIPANARTFGRDYATMYERLAQIAYTLDTPAAKWMAIAFEGNAFHHIQDACNQIHTVQVGDFEFFRRAWMERLKRDFRVAGGLLGPRLSIRDVGIRFLTNHHLFVEELMAEEMLAAVDNPEEHPHGARLLEALVGENDPRTVDEMLEIAGQGETASSAAMMTLANRGSAEVEDLYRLSRDLAAPDLMRWDGSEFQQGRLHHHLAEPMASLRQRASFDEFFRIHERAMQRCGTVLRQWRSFVQETPEQAAAHLALQLQMLHLEVEARLAAFDPDAGEDEDDELNHPLIVGYGAFLTLTTVGLGFLAWRSAPVLRRRRRS